MYLLENGACIAKKKTRIARKTLDPLYQQSLVFDESPQGKVLQVSHSWFVFLHCDRPIVHTHIEEVGKQKDNKFQIVALQYKSYVVVKYLLVPMEKKIFIFTLLFSLLSSSPYTFALLRTPFVF